MLGGVLAECVAPRLMARFGDRAVLATGLLLLGGAALLLVPAVDVVLAVLVCGLRGLGFGFAVVVTGALVTRHVPAERRGEGLAVAGVAACLPAVAALAAGVWLADACGADVVFVVAALVALVGVLAPLALVAHADKPAALVDAAAGSAAAAAGGLVALACIPVQRRSAVLFAATTVAAGVVVAYLPRPRRAPPSPSACSCRRWPRPRPATARAAGATGTATPGWSVPAWRRAGSGWSSCSASTSPQCCSRRWRCSGPASAWRRAPRTR
jgi:MFS family permease